MNANRTSTPPVSGVDDTPDDDIPDMTAPEWQARIAAAPLINRGGRPKAAVTKQKVNLRISPDVLDYYRATGPGWQTRMEAALRAGMKL